jgi:hypothetical protein
MDVVEPVTHSPIVRVEGKPIIRYRDKCTLYNGSKIFRQPAARAEVFRNSSSASRSRESALPARHCVFS